MLAHRIALGHGGDGLGPQVLGVRRREADAVDAVDGVERAQQVGELRAVLPGAEVASVGVDVLTEHGDLAYAVGGELLDLVDDVAHAPADLGPAHDRDDAERARVVAADLDGDPRAVAAMGGRVGATGGQRRRVGLVLLEDLDHRALEAGPFEQGRRVAQVVGAEHDVDVTGPLHDELAVLLGQAPAHRDLQVGALLLQRLEPPQLAVELVVGVLTDAARVEHDDIGRLDVVGGLHALGREQPGDALGVVLVHLTAERAHVEAARPRLLRRGGLVHGRSVYGGRRGSDHPSVHPTFHGLLPVVRGMRGADDTGRDLARGPARCAATCRADQLSTSTGASSLREISPSSSETSTSSMPTSWRIFSLISSIMSMFSDRKVLAFSRP